MAVDWLKIRNDFDDFFQSEGSDVDVVLKSGETFSVKMVKRHRRAGQDLTDGLQQQLPSMSVMAHRWDSGAGRAPQKGDQMTFDGRRFAIEEWNSVVASDQRIGYNLVVKG